MKLMIAAKSFVGLFYILVIIFSIQSTVFAQENDGFCTEEGSRFRTYPQCGGTLGLEDKPIDQTFWVTECTSPSGIKTYRNRSLGNIAQCPTTTCPVTIREYPQCGGTIKGVTYPKNHSLRVFEITDCNGRVTWDGQDMGDQGECGSDVSTYSGSSNSVTTRIITKDSPEVIIPALGQFKFYCQADPKYQTSCFDAQGTCGPTSMAMALSIFGSTLSPLDIDRSFQAWRPVLRSCGAGGSNMTTAITGGWLKTQGFTYEPLCAGVANCNKDAFLRRAKEYLDAGYIIMGSQSGWRCPKNCKSGYANHILIIDGADIASRQLNIRDPLNCGWLNGNTAESTPGGFKRSVDEGEWFYGFAIKRT